MQILHDFFGVMELNEQRRQFSAALDFPAGHKVSVTIDYMGISPDGALKLSCDICERIREREPEYRRKIAQDLLDLYNENWRVGQILDIDGLMSRISLANLAVSPADYGTNSSGVTLYYADGNLFAGHSIEVLLGSDFGYVDSELAG